MTRSDTTRRQDVHRTLDCHREPKPPSTTNYDQGWAANQVCPLGTQSREEILEVDEGGIEEQYGTGEG
jgi:hypothetical protein